MKPGFKTVAWALFLTLGIVARSAAQNSAADAFPNRLPDLNPSPTPTPAFSGSDNKPGGNTNQAVAYYNSACKKADASDWDGAIADYNRAIELYPGFSYAFDNRGIAKGSKGDDDGALADFKRSIELNPANPQAYYNRALIEKKKNDNDSALADLNRAIELDPKYVNAYNNRGVIKRDKGDLDGALADYNRAIELDPGYVNAYFNRAYFQALARNWTAASADYHREFELSGKDHDYAHLYVWLIDTRLGKTDTANKELSAYLEQRAGNNKSASGDWVAKVAGHLLGTVTEADLFAAAASPDEKKDKGQHCEAWFYAGMKKLLAGDKKTAADYFHKCLATDQKNFTEYQMAQSELKALGE